MDRTVQQWRFKEGDEVVSADDHKLGKVVRFEPDMLDPTHLVVEKGLIFKHDYRIPVSAVANYQGDTIFLSLTKDAALNARWDATPDVADTTTTSADQPW